MLGEYLRYKTLVNRLKWMFVSFVAVFAGSTLLWVVLEYHFPGQLTFSRGNGTFFSLVVVSAAWAFCSDIAEFWSTRKLRRELDRKKSEVDVVGVQSSDVWQMMLNDLRGTFKKESADLAGAIDQKKQMFLNLPNVTFHFANKDQINGLYDDYFKEPTVEQMVSKLVGEVSGDVKGAIPQVLESRVGGKNLTEWMSTIKLPGISTEEKFRRWQQETIKKDQVTLGLELVDVDLSDLTRFDDLIAKLATQFQFNIADQQLDTKRVDLKRSAATRTISRLENLSGWALVEGRFTITEMSPDFYRCIYDHPVNELVADAQKRVTISIMLRKQSLEPSIAGNYAQSVGRVIPLRVYGTIWQPLDSRTNTWEVQIAPMVVY